jgi:transposase
MQTEFGDSDMHYDLFIRTVDVNIEDITPDDATGEERELIGKRKYIAVYNPDREKSDIDDLNGKMDLVKMRMSETSDQSDLKKSLGKLRSFVNFSRNGAVMNEKRVPMLRSLAGRFMVVTNTDLPVEDIVEAYKEQWTIERSFRTIKSFLEIRPVGHSKSERIRAHVFVAVLSLLLSRIIEKRTDATVSQIADVLSELKAIPVRIPGGRPILRSVSESADSVLSLLSIPIPKKVLGNTPTQ